MTDDPLKLKIDKKNFQGVYSNLFSSKKERNIKNIVQVYSVCMHIICTSQTSWKTCTR